MATEARSGAAGDRRVLVVTLILFGGVTGAVFGRVFLGTNPAFRLAAAETRRMRSGCARASACAAAPIDPVAPSSAIRITRAPGG